jgi:uncharacterized membrane protein
MHALPLLIALFVAFLWGTLPAVHKYVLGRHDPVSVIAVSAAIYAVCTIALVFWYWPRIKKDVATWRPRTFAILAANTIIAGFLANLLYMYVLKKHDSHIVSALVCISPVFTLLLAVLFLGERPTALGALGVVLIVAGVVCVAYQGPVEEVSIEAGV